MDKEVLDSPLDLSIPRSDTGPGRNFPDYVSSNNSFSSSGMTEALSWSDQLLRVKSVMTIAQLEEDWKAEEEEDLKPWRFRGQVFMPMVEEVNDVVNEVEMNISESKSLEVGQEFHIFGGKEEGSEIPDQLCGEPFENIGQKETPSLTAEENPLVELEELQLASQFDQPASAEEELDEVTHVALLPTFDGKSMSDIPPQEVESLVDNLALKDLVVIECEPGQDQLLLEDDEKDLNQEREHKTLTEPSGLGQRLYDLWGTELNQRKVSLESVSISEGCGGRAEKGTFKAPVNVQCWKLQLVFL